MNKVILIGGAPTNGKSYIAKLLAQEFNIPWISTDTIRETMREIVNKEDYPELFHFYGNAVSAEEYLSTHTPQEIIDSQNKESVEVWKGVKALVENDYVWKTFIVEGVAVLPNLVSQLDKNKVQILPIFLIDDDVERVRDVVFKRGLWDDADKYPDSVKEIEVKWAMEFSQFINLESAKYGYGTNIIGDREKFISNLKSKVSGWL